MKILLLLLILLPFSIKVRAQIQDPIMWSYGAKRISKTEAVLFIKADLQNGWHIYSTAQPDGGPKKTTFDFSPSSDYSISSKIQEPKAHVKFDSNYGIKLLSFDKSVVFQQKIHIKKSNIKVEGRVEFMVCNDHQCLSPETIEFSIPVQ